MRSLLLASAAICLTASTALAQTTGASPAPTGAPNAAAASPIGSPGNMAPANNTQQTTQDPTMSATATGTPAPEGAPNGAQETQPGTSPGKTAPAPNSQATANTPTATATPMNSAMSYTHNTALPQNASAQTDLHIAAKAISQHNKTLADNALSHAETLMLTRAVPASTSGSADSSPGITAIENARHALQSGDYRTAASDTKMAMHAHHGTMGETPPMGGSDTMGGPTQ